MATATVTATATESPASLPTSTTTQPVPASFDSPVNRNDGIPAIAILTLVAVIIFSIILLSAISYFIFLRFRGKCPNCPAYEDELKKWKRGELKPIVPFAVYERMRELDVEKGGMDLQVKMYQDRMQTLASLEGRKEAPSEYTLHSEEGKVEEDYQVDAKLKKPSPAHLSARNSGCHLDAVRPVSEDPEATLVNDTGHPASYSIYQRDVIAPREVERKRLLQEAEEQAFTKICNMVSDSTYRESVLQRAKDELNEIVTVGEKEKKKKEEEEQSSVSTAGQKPPPRQGQKSRFVERFSLATIENLKV